MGLLVGDTVTFDSGVTLTNFVVSVKGSANIDKILIYDENRESHVAYRVFFNVFYYTNQEAYESGKPYFNRESKQLDLTEEQATANIFTSIYAYLASTYQVSSGC